MAPSANVSVRVLSPKPLDPATDLTLAINGVPQAFTYAPVAGDPSGREWVLSWTHAPYPIDHYEARAHRGGRRRLQPAFPGGRGGASCASRIPSPSPIPSTMPEPRSRSSWSREAAWILQIRVFTTSGHLIYERDERGMAPGIISFARTDGMPREMNSPTGCTCIACSRPTGRLKAEACWVAWSSCASRTMRISP